MGRFSKLRAPGVRWPMAPVAPVADEPPVRPVAPTEDAPPPAPLGIAAAGGGARSFRERAHLRRRLRYLRRTRELAFRDLGGFVFDARRFDRPREDIVEAKLKGLLAMDRELRALETALGEHQELMLLHEPGITVCPRCGAIHGSDANFCAACGLPRGGAGLPLGPRAPLPPGAATPPLTPLEQPTVNMPAASRGPE